jgi:hypothetical protein
MAESLSTLGSQKKSERRLHQLEPPSALFMDCDERSAAGYLPLTDTLPPPSGSSAVFVPTRRQIKPLLSRIVIA